MTKHDRERRRREKHRAQKQRHRENIVKDAARRLLGELQDSFGFEQQERLVYDHQLSDEDHAKVYDYLARRYPAIGR